MLVVKNLEAGYGKVQVLWDISFEINEKEVVCLLGPNGAGKTTTLKVITGLLKPYRGEIFFKGINIKGMPPFKISRLGISIVPEGRELFPYMSVEENLLIGLEKVKDYKKERLEYVYNLFPILKERRKQVAKTLSGGEQQMLAIARALVSNPSLLILDEPSTGLAPKVVSKIFEKLAKLKEEGLTLLIVEQNVRLALEIADRAYLIENGRIVLSGRSQELMESELIKHAYLGE